MKLVPIYLIAGNDASAINNEADIIINYCKNNGYEFTTQDNPAGQHLSLFNNKQIIQISYYNDINIVHSKIIIKKCSTITNNSDTIFLIKIYNSKQIHRKTKLLSAICKLGKVIIKQTKNVNAFTLMDSISQGDNYKVTQILTELKNTNLTPILILCTITNYLRKIKNYRMLVLAQSIDASIKGIEPELLWHRMQILCLNLCKISIQSYLQDKNNNKLL